MAISQAMCSSFKKELLEAKHNFLNSGGSAFKVALYTDSAVPSNMGGSGSTMNASVTNYATNNENKLNTPDLMTECELLQAPIPFGDVNTYSDTCHIIANNIIYDLVAFSTEFPFDIRNNNFYAASWSFKPLSIFL